MSSVIVCGTIEWRINAVQHALRNGYPVHWIQDDNFNCSYEDIFDGPVKYVKNTDNTKNPTIIESNFSDILIKPHIICDAEEKCHKMGLLKFIGAELNSINVPDSNQPLYIAARNRQEIILAQSKWGSRVTYYKRRIWGTHRKEGVYEALINFLLFSMCGQINTSTDNGVLAERFGYG